MLGISDSEELQTMSDSSEKYHAFVANRALWCYDADKEAVRRSLHSARAKMICALISIHTASRSFR